MPHSPRLAEVHQFIESGWHRRDFRTNGFPKALSAGYVTDQDLISVDDMRRHPYYEEWLASVGLRWFAGFCFKAGSKTWGAAVQGTAERGPFFSGDIENLMRRARPVGVGGKAGVCDGQPEGGVAGDSFRLFQPRRGSPGFAGKIGWLNARAEAILKDAELSPTAGCAASTQRWTDNWAIYWIEPWAFAVSVGLILSGPVLAPTSDRRTFSVDAIPMPRDFQSLLSAAAVLVTMHEIEVARSESVRDLRAQFKLTGREIELCAHLLSGRKIAQAAVMMGMSVSTARQHAKSIFAKTGTHGQSEVVALLSRLASEPLRNIK